jgi:16S rRNA (guanine1516-N2)-methyltransferase
VCKTDALPLSYPPGSERARFVRDSPVEVKRALHSKFLNAIVTTAPSGEESEARDLASRFGLQFEPRNGRPLHEILVRHEKALVLGSKRADLYEDGRAWRASAGLAYLRLLRAKKGEIDPLVAAADLKPGEQVLDATLGLAGDALLAGHATQTKVIGLEKDGLLCAFTAAGLKRLKQRPPEIEIVQIDHRDFLRAQKAKSFDVVLLDPMFQKPGDAGPSFSLLRKYGEHSRLEKETLEEARRVSRRGVLVKDSARGEELRRLGLVPKLSPRTAAIAFGWAAAL